MRRLLLLFVPVAILALSFQATAQVSQGGLPVSFPKASMMKPVVYSNMQWVDVAQLQAEDLMLDTMKSYPWRFGDNLYVDLSPQNSGVWDTLNDGTKVWRLGIRSAGALTINLTFDKYLLPQGAKLFVYNSTKSDVIGAFTDYNNQADSVFATTLVRGDSIIIEYNEPDYVSTPALIHLWRVTHGYRSAFDYAKAFGDAGSCQINVACPTGVGWENEIRSVCMLVTNGSGFCTGSLVNNTANDGTPYILTANHCYSTPSSWVFWFNWQSATCTNPSSSPSYNSISGATLKARTTTSDFCLVQMNSTPPTNYNVYYAGWNRTTTPPPSGMGIHHPNGDIKKISPAGQLVNYGSYNAGNGAADCWQVPWSGTACTEPGSSGSPIFDNTHLIVGQLYGGPSACGASSANMNDFYGRFCTSWTGDGTNTTRLSNWLDPSSLSPTTLPGYDPAGPQAPTANFSATPTTSCTGIIQFTDASSGTPTSWLWNFGDGTTSTIQSPSHTYTTNGTYTVTLAVTNTVGSDTATMTNYITINLPSAPTANGGSSCGPGTVTLTGTGTGNLEWYNTPTGGSPVGTGNTFTTPSISTTTTFYVQDSVPGPSQYVGMLNDSTTGGMFTASNAHYLTFDCTSACSLVSVEVNAGAAGNRTITLQNSAGTTLQSTTVNIPSGKSRITLNFNIPVGTGLRLVGPGSPNLYRSNSGVSYPYTLTGIVSITGSDAGATYYYYFYKWEVKTGSCLSSRVPVVATINTPVSASVSAAVNPGGAICSGTSVTFTATAANGGTAPLYQWVNNGTAITGATNSTYTSNALANGDIITCVMTSNAPCVSGSPATSAGITMVINSTLPASVSIAANPGISICSGESVTYTATPANGGSTPLYQWIRNGTNISGATNSTYTTASLANGDIITCTLTSNLSCVTGSPATSNTLTMVINAVAPAGVNISANPGSTVCSGTGVTFTATPTNGGATPSYQWRKNGTNINGATLSTYSSSSLANNDAITCVMTSSSSCVTSNPATSSSITMTVNQYVAAALTINAAPSTTICSGTGVTFTASPANGGSTPSYQWKRNGMNITGATNATYSSSAIADGDIITCIMTSNASCVTGSPVTSNAISMTVDPSVSASVNISANPAGAMCIGTSVTFTATGANGGTSPTYQWNVNGSIITGATNQTYISSTLSNNDEVTCIMTSNATCVISNPATSNAVTVSINSTLTPAVSISASPSTTTCPGTTITFTATPVNGGASPVYAWQVNGNTMGANSPIYSSSILNTGDVVTCQMSSSESCATGNPAASNQLTIDITTLLSAAVIISANPGINICAGTNVVFTAIPYNGGAPSFQWYINGNAVGTNNSTFASATLGDGDVVTCVMTSSESCATNNPATSNPLTVALNQNYPVSVSIIANPPGNICSGQSVTFAANAVNGGTNPVYQWQLNGMNVGTNSSIFTITNLIDGDIVNCLLISSLNCAAGNPAISNTYTASISAGPSTPVITQNGDTLVSSETWGNQWYYHNSIGSFPISGATGQTYLPLVTGEYFSIVSNLTGCSSDTSNMIYVVVVGINEFENITVHVYPNPVTSMLYIDFTGSLKGATEIEIFDCLGQVMNKESYGDIEKNASRTMDMSSLPKGIYFLRIKNEQLTHIEKLLRQ